MVRRPAFAGSCRDWSLGADATWKKLALNRSRLGTGICDSNAPNPWSRFSKERDGAGDITGSTVAALLTSSLWPGGDMMQDLLWLGALGGLLAATLAYARLCDKA